MNRKLLALLLAGVMIFALAACGSAASEAHEDEAPDSGAEVAADEQIGEIVFDQAFSGQSSSGAAMLLVNASGSDYTGVAGLNEDDSLGMSYVGPSSVDEDGLMTIVDLSTGESFQCYLFTTQDEDGDDCILLTQDGETGFYLYPSDVEAVLTVMANAGVTF